MKISNKTILSSLFAGFIAMSLPMVSQAEPQTITFLHVNDVYGVTP